MSARNETPHVIIQTLGQKKCNGSWDASTEDLSMDQVKQVAEKQKDRLTGATLYARSREVMGCLLYTSPSPRDLSTSRMPSSA